MLTAGLFAQNLSAVNSNNIKTAQKDVTRLQLFLFPVSLALDDLPIDDVNIVFFVSAYISASISHRRKCSACMELLVDGNKPCNIDDSIPDENKQLFLQVDRGGLYAPTAVYICVVHIQFCTAIYADTTVKHKLFASSNQ